MIDMEGTHDNDDDELTFITLGAATQNVIRYLGLDEHEKEIPGSQRESGSSDERERAAKLEYVERRIADLKTFERIAMYGPRRKGK